MSVHDDDPIERGQIFRSHSGQDHVRVLEVFLGWDERSMVRVEHRDASISLWEEKQFRAEHIRTYLVLFP